MSTEEQREEISGRLGAASAWLEDEGFGATTGVRVSQGTGAGWEHSFRGQRRWEELWCGAIRKAAGLLPGLPCYPPIPFPHPPQMLKEKLAELRKLCQGLFFRVEERRKLPERLSALDSLLNHSSMFLR